MTLLALAFSSSLAAVAVPQANAPAAVSQVVILDVAGDATYTIPYVIRIEDSGSGFARSREELDRRAWVAVRTSDRGEDRASVSSCPAVGAAVRAFAELAPLAPSSVFALQFVENGTLPIGPIMLDGFPAKISWTTFDGTKVETTGGYAHRLWAHQTIVALMDCWGR